MSEPCAHPASWFSRTLCPEPCGTMHNYCTECGDCVDEHCAIREWGPPNCVRCGQPMHVTHAGVWMGPDSPRHGNCANYTPP